MTKDFNRSCLGGSNEQSDSPPFSEGQQGTERFDRRIGSITWLGHNCWRLRWGKTTFLVDPFLTLPDSVVPASSVTADYLLVSHGHADHCAQAAEIAGRCGSTVVAMAEVAGWFSEHGIKKTEPMNIGGGVWLSMLDESGNESKVRVTMTPALHSSTMPDGKSGGNSAGFLLSFPPKNANGLTEEIRPMKETLAECLNIYFACDTGWFAEMERLGAWGIDCAVVPIGDRYTMGPAMSLDAVRSLRPKIVIPAHFNTWPPIAQNVQKWAEAVRKYTDAEPVVLSPGAAYTFSCRQCNT